MVKSIVVKKSTKSSGKRISARPQSQKLSVSAAPATFGYRSTKSDPSIANTGRTVRVRHSEYVGDLNLIGSSPVSWDGKLKRFPLNPGIPTVFPWLSQIANQYEMYRFHRLCFRYVPRVSTSIGGAVHMAVDFDALDSPPSDKATLLSYSGCTSSSVWQAFDYTVRPDKLGLFAQQRYTRLGNQSDLDLKTYDLGNLFVLLDENFTHTGGYQIGELHVDYEVEFFVPQLRTGVTAGSVSSADKAFDTTIVQPVTTKTGAIPARVVNNDTGGTDLIFDQPWEGLLSFGSQIISGSWPGIGVTMTSPSGGAYTTVNKAGNDGQGWTLIDYAVKAFAGDKLTLKLTSSAAFFSSVLRFAAGAYVVLGGV